jgi:hypothetical protein
MSPDFDDAAFADYHLIENSAILQRHRNDSIPDSCFRTLVQMAKTLFWNRKDALHVSPLGFDHFAGAS